VEPTVSREQLIQLMQAANGLEFAEDLLARLGLGDKQQFTEKDMSMLMLAANHAAQDVPGQRPGGDPAKDAHMHALLGALDAHALPLIGKQLKP
jgi:hypothetical protein